MFYAHFVLSKKGPLARIWLAAHWDRKLTKAHVFETNIDSSVEAIIQPKVKMALRTSGHLLLGVVRIYSRKAKYLLADCNEAFVKIKMAFRPGVVDMPEENREAAVATITLPETFHDFDTTMADLSDIDVQAQFSVNQSRPEEITMREDLGNITLVGDDGFGDMDFDDRNIIQDANMDDTLYKNPDSSNILLDDSLEKNQDTEKPMDIDFDAPQRDDDFGKEFDDFEGPAGCDDDDDSDNDNFGGGVDDELFGEGFMGGAGGLFEEPPAPEVPLTDPQVQHQKDVVDVFAAELQKAAEQQQQQQQQETELEMEPPVPDQTTVRDQTTLVANEAEAFALEPLDVTSLGTERKTKRKRKLVVDEQKGIASETMKMQLSDTSEIMTTLDLAPPTKKLMHWKETGGVEKLFALPGRGIPSKKIGKLFSRNLITKPVNDEDDEDDRLELEAQREEEHPRDEGPVYEPPHMEPPPMVEDQPSRLDPEPVRPSLDQSAFSAHDTTAFSQREESLVPHEVSLPQHEVSMPQQDVSLPQLPASEPQHEPEVQPEPEIPQHEGGEEDLAQRSPSSSEGGDNDDIFMELMPDEPDDAAEDGKSEGADDVEERRWTKRTQQMSHILTRAFADQDTTSFGDMCLRNFRKQVASKFYTLLVLKKQNAIEVSQQEPYSDIIIRKGPRFEHVY